MNRKELEKYLQNDRRYLNINKSFYLVKENKNIELVCTLTENKKRKIKSRSLDLAILEIKLEMESIFQEISNDYIKYFILNL